MAPTLEGRWHVQLGSPIRQVAFSADGSHVAVALGLGSGPEGVVLDAREGREASRFDSRAQSAGGVAWTGSDTLVAAVLDDLGWALLEWRMDGSSRRLRDLEGTGYTQLLLHGGGRWLALVSDGVELLDLATEGVPTVWSRKAQSPLGCRGAWDASGRLWLSNLDGGALVALSEEGQEVGRLDGPSEGGTEVLLVDRGHLYAAGLPGPGAVMVDLASGELVQPRFFGPKCRGVYLPGISPDSFIGVSGKPTLLELNPPARTVGPALFTSVTSDVDRWKDRSFVMGSVDGDVALVALVDG